MTNTSGTYDFQSIQVEPLIRDAFEHIGVLPEFITPQKLDSARRSIDLLLLEWMNKTTNLWTLRSEILSLNEFQIKYFLEKYVLDITELNLRTSTRQLDGMAASSNSGVAANAFDDDPGTVCTQNAPNGDISYDYGEGAKQSITFIGVTSNADTEYSLNIEYSLNNADWKTISVIAKQNYLKGNLVWIDITAPVNAQAYRIKETGGAILNIQEIYFNNNVLDTTISGVSRDEYLQFPQKNITGRPSVFYFDRSINPSLSIWPAPTKMYNAIRYSYKKAMQDVGLYTNSLEIPARFYPALVAGLSFKLALKFNNQIAEMLNQEYQNTFNLATIADSEDTVISINTGWSS
jgi:hypothetical protein